MLSRNGDRHPSRARTSGDHRPLAAAHLHDGPDRRHHHAGRHLLRGKVRRLDHLDPAEHAGRSVVRGQLHRRVPNGTSRPCRRGPWDRCNRLVHRWVCRPASADFRCSANRRFRPQLLIAGVFRADGNGIVSCRPSLGRFDEQVGPIAGSRPVASDHRNRSVHRSGTLHLRQKRASRRNRLHDSRDRRLRNR